MLPNTKQYMTVMGLCIYYTFTIILEKILPTYKKVCCKTIFYVTMAAASCMLFTESLDCIIFSGA